MGGLSGKYAVVTGGSQGLGEAIARTFAKEGAAGIVICGRNAANGERVAKEIAESGCPTFFVRADLAKVSECRKVIEEADRRFGRLDVLVNAAALTDRGNIFDTTEERYNEIFDVNARAPFFLIQGAVTLMKREKIQGSIVNIQSMSAHGGQPFITAYCASKAALAGLTRNVAHSLLKYRIRVNGLNIGWMSTVGEDSHPEKVSWRGRTAGSPKPSRRGRSGRLIDPQGGGARLRLPLPQRRIRIDDRARISTLTRTWSEPATRRSSREPRIAYDASSPPGRHYDRPLVGRPLRRAGWRSSGGYGELLQSGRWLPRRTSRSAPRGLG